MEHVYDPRERRARNKLLADYMETDLSRGIERGQTVGDGSVRDGVPDSDRVVADSSGNGMKVYISGPIAGRKNGNRATFDQYEQALLERGYEAISPHKLSHEHEGECKGAEVPHATGEPADLHRYGCYMKADLEALLPCDAILMLPGWRNSKGATVEYAVASICGIRIIDGWNVTEVTGI